MIGQQGHFPYGESWYAQNTTTNWQFTSYQRDTESGNDYAMARSYVNRLARFSSPDPADFTAVDPLNPQSWNRYAYALNSPTVFSDPLGLDPCAGSNQTWSSNFANGTGIFDPQDCGANGGTWDGSNFLNGAGGGDPGGGPGPNGGGMPGCTQDPNADDNMTGVAGTPNCPPTGSSGGGGTWKRAAPKPPPQSVLRPNTDWLQSKQAMCLQNGLKEFVGALVFKKEIDAFADILGGNVNAISGVVTPGVVLQGSEIGLDNLAENHTLIRTVRIALRDEGHRVTSVTLSSSAKFLAHAAVAFHVGFAANDGREAYEACMEN